MHTLCYHENTALRNSQKLKKLYFLECKQTYNSFGSFSFHSIFGGQCQTLDDFVVVIRPEHVDRLVTEEQNIDRLNLECGEWLFKELVHIWALVRVDFAQLRVTSHHQISCLTCIKCVNKRQLKNPEISTFCCAGFGFVPAEAETWRALASEVVRFFHSADLRASAKNAWPSVAALILVTVVATVVLIVALEALVNAHSVSALELTRQAHVQPSACEMKQ